MDPIAKDILTFWFGTTDMTVEIERREVWFKSTPEFDAHLIDNYARLHEQAAAGGFDHFMDVPENSLALALMLDQFPRNIYRGTAKAFHTDAKAREVAKAAIEREHHVGFSNRPKSFFFLPLEHSEELADQKLALELYATLNDERSMSAAQGHHDAVARFGRFPHRNKVLGRPNTPEEEEYLRIPPTWGMTAAEAAERAKMLKEQGIDPDS
tara:strand:- start:4563 stop:5195 length:633 start_codon:yes stop_codon:yes gene_type:complete